MSRLLAFTLLAAACLGSAAGAQQTVPLAQRPVLRKLAPVQDRPVLHVTYDAQLARIRSVRSSAPAEFGLVAPPCFDNSDIWLADTYIVSNPGEEVLNWGFKNCPGASRLRSFTLLYLSTARNVAEGGPGGTLSVALYAGTRGFGQVGTEVFRRTIFGLPSSTLVSPLVFLTIDFGTDPLPLPDGNIGWGFVQLDGDTGPVLVIAPKPLLGTVDAMDIYSPGPASAASYVGTFNYGGVCPCANTFLQLDEIANNEVALTTELNGSGVNPPILDEVFPPRIGRTWAGRVAVVHPPGSTTPPFTLLFNSAAALSPRPTRFGEVLIDLAQRLSPPLLEEGSYAFGIPGDTSLVGVRLFLQAAVLPPVASPIVLTNALSLRLGF